VSARPEPGPAEGVSDAEHDDSDDAGSLDSLDASLSLWAADRREEQGAAQRGRAQRLRALSDDESTFADAVADLAGQPGRVVVDTIGGRTRRGRILALGRDFFVVGDRDEPGRTIVALSAVAAIGADRDTTDRQPVPTRQGRATLAGTLSRLAGERRQVSIVAGGMPVAGELSSVGRDIVAVKPEGPASAKTFVQLRLIEEVSLFGSG
jgi:hypothetical protein